MYGLPVHSRAYNDALERDLSRIPEYLQHADTVQLQSTPDAIFAALLE